MSLERLKWDYIKFKEFEKFILEFEKTNNISIFIEKNIRKFKRKTRNGIHTEVKNMSEKEQLLLLYLKSLRRQERKDNNLVRNYLEFCKHYYENLRVNMYEQRLWEKQLIYNLGSKRNLMTDLMELRISVN